MPPLDASHEQPDPKTWALLRELLDANDAWRVAYQQWIRANAGRASAAPEAIHLREAEQRVAAARAKMDSISLPRADEKSWSAH